MKNKLKILSDATCIKEYYLKSNSTAPCITSVCALSAIDEYGKELSIDFARWITEETHFTPTGEVNDWKRLHMDNGWEFSTTEELFNMYLLTINK